eukprot:6174717-Pyramimonas_sp.AAC.1
MVPSQGCLPPSVSHGLHRWTVARHQASRPAITPLFLHFSADSGAALSEEERFSVDAVLDRLE